MSEIEGGDAHEVAKQVGRAMYQRDSVAQRMGIQLQEIRPGYARMSMDVRESMIGGHDLCHGGYTFLLVDTACAYACNSHNLNSVSHAVDIVFMAPIRLGERLIAVATENDSVGRTGVYDIRIANSRDDTVALARGQCRIMKEKVVNALPALRGG